MNALTTTRAGAASLAPQTWGEAQQFAQLLAGSTMVPKDFQGKPGNIMVAIQWGAEVGLGPLQAVQNIAVINGRPSIWGDAALALVRGHPACEAVREGVSGDGDARHGWCEVTRKGQQPERRTFSVGDAKRAGLWGKTGPWQQYPERMLQLRARGFAIRDVFPDALRGVITQEEARDLPAEPREVASTVVEPAPRPAVAAPAAPEQAGFPILAPDGSLKHMPAGRWLAGVSKALALLEDADAVRAWRQEMGPHLAAVAEADDLKAHEADHLIETRLAELAPAEREPGEEG